MQLPHLILPADHEIFVNIDEESRVVVNEREQGNEDVQLLRNLYYSIDLFMLCGFISIIIYWLGGDNVRYCIKLKTDECMKGGFESALFVYFALFAILNLIITFIYGFRAIINTDYH